MEILGCNVQVISFIMLTARLRNQTSREGKNGGRDVKRRRDNEQMTDKKVKRAESGDHVRK